MTAKRQRRSKPWWHSKVNIINLLSVLAVVLESTPMLDVVPDGHEKHVALAVFVVNIVLRTFFTDTPIGAGVAVGTTKRVPGAVPTIVVKQTDVLLNEGHRPEDLVVVSRSGLQALAARHGVAWPDEEPAFLGRGRRG